MNVGKAIYNILTTDANVSDIVGTRVFPNVVDYGVNLPAITYTEVTNNPTNTKTGASELDQVTVQVTCFSVKYSEVVDLSEKVRRALDYKVTSFEDVVIQRAFFQDSVDLHDKEYGETGCYQRNMDFLVRVKNI